MASSKILLVLITAVIILLASGSTNGNGSYFRHNVVRHGNSYYIQPVGDDGLYLTATQHLFRPKAGVFVGRVLTNTYHGGLNQLWDAITWPDTQGIHDDVKLLYVSVENQFWLYAKAAALNEITAVPLSNSSIPPKNLVELAYMNINSPETIYRSQKYRFMIKSLELGKCVQSHGLDYQISYETCDGDKIEQLWTAEPYVDDAVFRNRHRFHVGQ